MDGFNLDREQARALLLQRTAYQPIWTPLAHKLGFSKWYSNTIATRTSARSRSALGRRYQIESEAEADSLLGHLPSATGRLLDIGCGLAGPDLIISRRVPGLQITLLDVDRFDATPYYGFHHEAAAYNSLATTKRFLVQNGMSSANIRTVNISCESFPTEGTYDAVVSMISWGFHYPVSTYLEPVYEALAPGGVAILDVRNNTEGAAALREKFEVTTIAGPNRGTSVRILARKPV